MNKIVLALALAVAGSASAAAPDPNLFAVVDIAAPAAELELWKPVVNRLAPGTPIPGPDAIGAVLGKLVGVPSVNGVDVTKPLHLALVNPQQNPQPLVLVLPVKDAKALVASVQPSLEAHIANGQAVVGAKATLAQLEKTIVAATRAKPDHGIHATAFVPPIWAAFGPQVRAVMAAGAASMGDMGVTLTKLGGLFLSAFDQADRLLIDLEADGTVPLATVSLDARPGTPMAAAFAAQKPNDFSLLSKVPGSDAPMVMAGAGDMKTLMSLSEAMFGDSKELIASMQELATVLTGEVAMVGQGGTQVETDYLMRVTDANKGFAALPRLYELLSKNGVMGSKMTMKPRGSSKYKGIAMRLMDVTYDFTKVPSYKGPKKLKTTMAYAGWDDVVGVCSGKTALEHLKKLVDTSRTTPPPALDASLQADLDKARGAQDSFYWRMDLSKVEATTQQASPLPAGSALVMRAGFTPTSGRFRFTLGQMPSSTGTRATSTNTPK